MLAGAVRPGIHSERMSLGKRIAIGVLSFVPLAALGLAAYGIAVDDIAVLYVGLVVSGIVDTGLAPIFIPHVHDNPRVGKDWKIVWIALLGIPYLTVAPLYWLLHILPNRPPPPEAAAAADAPLGGAWYADPWGEAPFRWWDGRQWTDWVTGPPGGGG
jgi:hypothetical protein